MVDVVGYVAEDTATIQISAVAKVKEYHGITTGPKDPFAVSKHLVRGLTCSASGKPTAMA